MYYIAGIVPYMQAYRLCKNPCTNLKIVRLWAVFIDAIYILIEYCQNRNRSHTVTLEVTHEIICILIQVPHRSQYLTTIHSGVVNWLVCHHQQNFTIISSYQWFPSLPHLTSQWYVPVWNKLVQYPNIARLWEVVPASFHSISFIAEIKKSRKMYSKFWNQCPYPSNISIIITLNNIKPNIKARENVKHQLPLLSSLPLKSRFWMAIEHWIVYCVSGFGFMGYSWIPMVMKLAIRESKVDFWRTTSFVWSTATCVSWMRGLRALGTVNFLSPRFCVSGAARWYLAVSESHSIGMWQYAWKVVTLLDCTIVSFEFLITIMPIYMANAQLRNLVVHIQITSSRGPHHPHELLVRFTSVFLIAMLWHIKMPLLDTESWIRGIGMLQSGNLVTVRRIRLRTDACARGHG